MGVVVLQLGQGGNQFGLSFFDALISNACRGAAPPLDFFQHSAQPDAPATARAVLIDMEPKVVAAVTRRARATGSWRYGQHSFFTQDSGSGNNWARGFCKHGPRCQEGILNLIRRLVEPCDMFGGFVTMQSIAGGTGAGLGAYLAQTLRDEYPSSSILSYCIWPSDGEVIVQCYNTILTLAHLQEWADGLVLVRNEAVMATCKRVLGIQRPSFDDMNQVGAHALASILLPAYFRQPEDSSRCAGVTAATGNISQTGPRLRVLSDLVSVLCAHPRYRMLALRATPQVPENHIDFTTFSWNSHLKQLKRMLYKVPPRDVETKQMHIPASNVVGRAVCRVADRCLANLLVLRGRDSLEADVSLLRDKALYPMWSVDALTVAAHPTNLGRYDMSAGLLSNCQSAIAPASDVLSRAYSMYSAKAYLFQYYDNGLDRDAFDASFATVEDVLAHYFAM